MPARVRTVIEITKPHKYTGYDSEITVKPHDCDQCRRGLVEFSVRGEFGADVDLVLSDDERQAIIESLGGTFNG